MRSILHNSRNVDHVRFNLTLIRHAETHANAEGIIQGLVDTDLSNIGYLQSQALGQHLQSHRFSHIYSSDLKRASETAQQIRLFNQVSPCQIAFDALLRERMYGVAQGRTRQWLRELAKEAGVPYVNFTPPGAETTSEVRERAITFFRKLCQDLMGKFGAYTLASKKQQESRPVLSRTVSSEDLSSVPPSTTDAPRQRSSSTGDVQTNTLPTITANPSSSRSSIDSALDVSSVASDQRSISSSLSAISRNSSFEKQRSLFRGPTRSPYENQFSDLDVLVVSHGAVIRELIKYFACDLQTDIGQHFDSIQDIAPNTSITRFQVTFATNENSSATTKLDLIDYHSKTHLVQGNNDERNLDVVNKCNL